MDPSDDERSIRRSLESLARRLRLAERDSHDVESTINAVIEELASGQHYPQWLLIFDNLEPRESLLRYLPSGPGHVLITSRDRGWADRTATVEVDVFSPAESVEMLEKLWPDLSDDEAYALADRLEHIPLALELATAVHRAATHRPGGLSLPEYLRLFDAIPDIDDGRSTEYPRSVAKTYRLAFEQLRARSLGAAQLLELCAFPQLQPDRGVDADPRSRSSSARRRGRDSPR